MAPTVASGTATNRSSAGYGRSCTNCSRAKCRCILTANGAECERCHRLGKVCQQIPPARQRKARRTASSRTALLEDKLDDLMSILRSSHQSKSQGSAKHPPSQALPHEPTQGFYSRLDSLAAAASVNSQEPTSGNPRCSIRPQDADPVLNTRPDALVRPQPTAEEAELYLDKFRAWTANFPFMHIAPETTAADLRRDRPILWLSVMNLTSMSLPQHVLLRDQFRREIAQRVIVNNERSLDILLSLIAQLGWAAMNTGPGARPFLVLYCQLASALMYDLGLNRAPDEEQQAALCLRAWSMRAPAPAKRRTLEERRAALALWFCTSICTSFVGKMDTPEWTAHMADSLSLLEREKEQPSDEVLVVLLKIQLLGDEARKLLRRDLTGDTTTPTFIFKPGLLSQLSEIRRSTPPRLLAHSVIQLQLDGVEAQAHSIGLFTQQTIPETMRISSMFSCAVIARRWFEILLAVPLLEVPGLPFIAYVLLSQVQTVLYRLSTSDDPAWDKEILRSTADLLSLMDRTIDMLRKVGEVYPLITNDDDGTLFGRCARICRKIRSSWEPSLTARSNAGGLLTPASQTILCPTVMADPAVLPTAPAEVPSCDLSDLSWMNDIFGPWEL